MFKSERDYNIPDELVVSHYRLMPAEVICISKEISKQKQAVVDIYRTEVEEKKESIMEDMIKKAESTVRIWEREYANIMKRIEASKQNAIEEMERTTLDVCVDVLRALHISIDDDLKINAVLKELIEKKYLNNKIVLTIPDGCVVSENIRNIISGIRTEESDNMSSGCASVLMETGKIESDFDAAYFNVLEQIEKDKKHSTSQ